MVQRPTWLERVNGDPLPWLLDESDPGVRAATLIRLMGRPPSDQEVIDLRKEATAKDPIRSILAAQDEAGWWVKPGPGYGPKYQGTVWNLIFLDQLGADPDNERVQKAVDYILRMCPTLTGGFGCSGSHIERTPPPSAFIHCLNGNLLRAAIDFGRLDHPAVKAATEWAARTITGEGVDRWYKSGTSGPGFECAANERNPCAWGAIKEMKALAAIPPRRRTRLVRQAIEVGAEFLLARDPAVADYPMGYGNVKPSGTWFKLGFPSGYICDVLEILEVLGELGRGSDRRLDNAKEWLLTQQDDQGRWRNRRAYKGKTTVEIDRQAQPSKWVTLRAYSVLAGGKKLVPT